MSDSPWDLKMKAFLKKTGEDFKRFGNDVKSEAQKLMSEVQDPARQQKLREGLKDVGVWARKTAEEVAKVVETGVKKAEQTLVKAGDKMNDFVVKPMETAAGAEPPAPAKTPPSPPPQMDEADDHAEPEAAPPKRTTKTVGKAGGKKKKAGSAPKKAARKTIGKE
jgi:ribosomal protein L22